MNAEEMARKGFYLVKSVIQHLYSQGLRFVTLWEGFEWRKLPRSPFLPSCLLQET